MTERNFDASFDSWLAACNELRTSYYTKSNTKLSERTDYLLEFTHGKKYIKIVDVRKDKATGDKSSYGVWAFIDKTNGNVLKPASYSAPAKHARGNIFDNDNGMKFIGLYGPAYLR